MKKIYLFMAMVLCLLGVSLGAMTYGPDYYKKNLTYVGSGNTSLDALYLFMNEAEDILVGTTGFVYTNPLYVAPHSTRPQTTKEGLLCYDADDDNLYVYANGGWVDLTAGAGTVTDMDTAYDGGSAVDVDTDAITLTVSDTDNNRVLDLVQNDTTNNPDAMNITNAGTGDGIQFASTGGGYDLRGTGSAWYIDSDGTAVFSTVTTTGTTTFGNGTSTVAVNSSVWDITTAGAVSGVTTLSMSDDLTFANGQGAKGSTTNAETWDLSAYDVDGAAYVATLTLTNGNTIAAALGTGVETVAVNSTTWDVSTTGAFTGVADITGTAGEAMTITLASDGAADDLTISVTGANDSSLDLRSAGTGTDAIKVLASAGGIDVDATNDDLSITNTANGAADDFTIAQAGNFDSSLLITSAGSGTDALSLTTTANAGDIVINSNDKIDMDSTGTFALNAAGDTLLIQVDSDGAADDLTIKVDGDDDSSIILDSDGTAADAVKIGATNAAGGIDVDAGTGGIDVTATGGAVALNSTKDAASAIALTANGGTSETVLVKATQGTGTSSVDIQSTAGGITLTTAAAKTVTVASTLTLNKEVLFKKGGDIASPAGGELDLTDGTYFDITGTNNITSIAAADSTAGRMIILQFDAVLTFTDGNNLKLAGNLTSSADDTIMLICDGTNWHEVSRSVN